MVQGLFHKALRMADLNGVMVPALVTEAGAPILEIPLVVAVEDPMEGAPVAAPSVLGRDPENRVIPAKASDLNTIFLIQL